MPDDGDVLTPPGSVAPFGGGLGFAVLYLLYGGDRVLEISLAVAL